MATFDILTEDTGPRRSGIERGDGQAFAHPAYFTRLHEHYCATHDHRWDCIMDPCIRHEATPCAQH